MANSAAARSVLPVQLSLCHEYNESHVQAIQLDTQLTNRMAARLQRSFGWERMEKDMGSLTTIHDIIEQNMIAVTHGLTPTNSLLPPTKRRRQRPCGAVEITLDDGAWSESSNNALPPVVTATKRLTE